MIKLQYLFKGGDEVMAMDIDRANKILHLASRATGFKLKRVEWWRLFDKGKERIQEMMTDRLSDKDFELAVVASMAQNGYTLIKREEYGNGTHRE